MATIYTPTQSVKTFDGTIIRYIQAGPPTGPVIILIPGWTQTATQFQKQIAYFSKKYNVISYDHRGQGESDKPESGYQIARFAADLNDLLRHLDLKDVTLLGHSMGCSVIWAYWSLVFNSQERIQNLVLVDQSACMTADPSWSAEEAMAVAAVFKVEVLQQMTAGLRGPDALTMFTRLLRSFFTPGIEEEDFQYMLQQNLKMSFENAATLLADHAEHDWTGVLPTIYVPTLVIGAEASVFGMRYIAEQIPGAELRIFSKEEKGNHFMFWENPELFNHVVADFLERLQEWRELIGPNLSFDDGQQ
ncbi:secreted hydrolase [Venturia nashicola]|uniref:Secreted hydrolase n=1 Tax=Venturia nashicola TaxID=86259 RepID=A0A4Z1PR53_9PEZI|nr:secreted hydrolase [Venturia nashicola]TLD37416.1 secreted hydrolase [Venturia nashicola]